MRYYNPEYENKVRQFIEGSRRKAYIKTYGCQQNVSDSEKIAALAENMGYELCDSPREASLVVFNTCAVRHSAEQKILGNVGMLHALKEKNPSMIIVLCGCMTQQEHVAEDIKKRYSFVDIVIGTSAIHELPRLIFERLTGGKKIRTLYDESGEIVEGIDNVRNESFRAFVPIMYGCNNFCTYCIVPYVRGRERSRRAGDVVAEAASLVAGGCREITLLGQNVNSYREPETGENFPQLLRRIAGIEGDFKIRFMTSHPKDASDELIDVIASCDKIAKHIHLPVQSGSDRVLKAMNRKYTRDGYLALVKRARERIDGLCITSDMIVGFPGETEEDFADTLSLVDEVGYDSLFTFLYSIREGTPAAKMPDQIPRDEKQRRFDALVELQTQKGFERNAAMKGTELTVLVDEVKSDAPGGLKLLSSRTDGNKIVEFAGPAELYGNYARVRVTEPMSWLLKGELIAEK
ncbi:MAG: tRNA (N6-isopentenyl adenosine(37)-C2)-methylthiotransferase MiaB [Clostridia bacterium]|nr:tRNA (N6-isopentenyl adenosine(37)-C2)-methylthiotransferase MiaB [Clostridia bacterium]